MFARGIRYTRLYRIVVRDNVIELALEIATDPSLLAASCSRRVRLLFRVSALAFRYRLSSLFAYRFRCNVVHFLRAASERKISPVRAVKAFLKAVHAAPSLETPNRSVAWLLARSCDNRQLRCRSRRHARSIEDRRRRPTDLRAAEERSNGGGDREKRTQDSRTTTSRLPFASVHTPRLIALLYHQDITGSRVRARARASMHPLHTPFFPPPPLLSLSLSLSLSVSLSLSLSVARAARLDRRMGREGEHLCKVEEYHHDHSLFVRNLLTRRLLAQRNPSRRSTDGKTLGRVIPLPSPLPPLRSGWPAVIIPDYRSSSSFWNPLLKPAETARPRDRSADADPLRRTNGVLLVVAVVTVVRREGVGW